MRRVLVRIGGVIFFRAADLERRKFFLAGVHESALIFAKSEACMFAFRRESRWKSGLCLIHFFTNSGVNFLKHLFGIFPKKSREPKSLRDICRKILLKTKKIC